MNILIALFSLFCLIYSAIVLIYLIFFKKTHSPPPDYYTSQYTISHHSNSVVSNKLASFKPSNTIHKPQTNRNHGFSQVQISKPPGILKNATYKCNLLISSQC